MTLTVQYYCNTSYVQLLADIEVELSVDFSNSTLFIPCEDQTLSMSILQLVQNICKQNQKMEVIINATLAAKVSAGGCSWMQTLNTKTIAIDCSMSGKYQSYSCSALCVTIYIYFCRKLNYSSNCGASNNCNHIGIGYYTANNSSYQL